jgi:hypothetical protein
MTAIGKKVMDPPHQHHRRVSIVRRSMVRYALLCFLGIGGLLSCALLGYVTGTRGNVGDDSATRFYSYKLQLQSDGSPLQQHGRGGGGGHIPRFRPRGQRAGAMRKQRQEQHASDTTDNTAKQEEDDSKWKTIPDGWENFTYSEIRHHFNCKEHANDQTKPLPSLDEWTFMRNQMKLLVDQRLNLNDPIPPTQGYSHGNTGAPPPYYPQRSEGKGRGLFASRDIKEGELVHDGPHSYIVFPDAMSFRRLIFALPRKSGCDITEWAWHQQLSPTGNLTILVDANIAALMNTSDEPNIAPKTDMGTTFYAVRNISKGEEIFYDYNIFDTDWAEVGLE